MKKAFVVIVFGLFIIAMFSGIASASIVDRFVEGTHTVGNALYNIAEPVLEAVLGGVDKAGGGDEFFVKFLFLILIFAILWAVLSRISLFDGHGWVLVIVNIAVSILATRWFGNIEIIRAAILPYSALGIAITCGLPLVLWFFITKEFTPTLRKLAWILFAVIFVGIWLARSVTDGSSTSLVLGGPIGSFAQIYLWTAVVALVMFGLDGTITKIVRKAAAEHSMSHMDLEHKYDLIGELEKHRKTRVRALRGGSKKDLAKINATISLLEGQIAALG